MDAAQVRRKLTDALNTGQTFVAFHSAGTTEFWPGTTELMPWEQLENTRDAFVVCPFKPDPEGCLVLRRSSAPENTDGAGPSLDHPIAPKNRYLSSVERLKKEIATTGLEKAILSRLVRIAIQRRSIPELFLRAMTEQPRAFICLLHCSRYGTWLGASPEILVKADGDRICVDSLAGTLPLAAAPTNPGHWSAKERDEQDIVTRMVKKTFEETGLSDISIEGPHVRRSAHVAHLHTELTARSNGVPLTRLIRALHPTPALCGTPRELAMDAISRLEEHDRELYGGFWGPWQCEGRTALHVNIRTMRIVDDAAILFTGGGITRDSDPQKEWLETEYKALTWSRTIEALKAGIS